MPSHFSSLGFDVSSEADMLALANEIGPKSESVETERGTYFRWRGAEGEELWLQQDPEGDLVGMAPHFGGDSALIVGLQSSVNRADDSVLDGAFYAWADPPPDSADSGAYPFVFDCPDYCRVGDPGLPLRATAQLAAFAHEITSFASEADYDAAEGAPKFASQSFIPSGLFAPDGEAVDSPRAMAIFTGLVRRTAVKTNELTDIEYYWAAVETLGGTFDVVMNAALLDEPPVAGGVLSGMFWISGRVLELDPGGAGSPSG